MASRCTRLSLFTQPSPTHPPNPPPLCPPLTPPPHFLLLVVVYIKFKAVLYEFCVGEPYDKAASILILFLCFFLIYESVSSVRAFSFETFVAKEALSARILCLIFNRSFKKKHFFSVTYSVLLCVCVTGLKCVQRTWTISTNKSVQVSNDFFIDTQCAIR